MITQIERLRDIYNNQLNYAVDEKTIEIAKRLLRRGTSIDDVVEVTDLDKTLVIQLKEELNSVVTV